MTAREMIKIIERNGWHPVEKRSRGSHLQLSKPGKVTISIHGGDLPAGTVKSIMKQAQIEEG